MSESISIELKRAAVTLAEELDYQKAAQQLGTTREDVVIRITSLEVQLCVYIFKRFQDNVELTQEGQFLVHAFRDSLVYFS